MAFSDDETTLIHTTVGALVDRRQPPEHLRDQLRLELEVDGHRVRIWEIRPLWSDATQTVRSGVAQFTYTRSRDEWKLYWRRRDGKWHAWDQAENTGPLDRLVRVVDEDRRGGFWG